MSLDWKTIEGQRVQAVLGAVGALPAAALVLSDNAAVVSPGAPLFLAAVVMVLGAYVHWLNTDGIYHLDSLEIVVPPDMYAARVEWCRGLRKPGLQYQFSTYAYAGSSMMLTIAGFAAIHTDIRLPVTVGWGFAAAGALLVVTLAEVLVARAKVNALLIESRTFSEEADRRMTR